MIVQRTSLLVSDIVELLRFCMSTTYFVFRGVIYEQVYGTAMGSPVSVVIANLYMEWFEQTALRTAPAHIRPRLWKRFVDDIWEVIKRGTEPELTAHLNQVDPTGNIQVTSEPETDRKLPFLDSLSNHHSDGSLTFSVYRKKTHTDQYLHFRSNHPLNHKLGVVRTLMDRCESIVSTPEDKAAEQDHIRKALEMNGYPKWAFKRVEQQRSKPKSKDTNKSQQKSKGTVSIPYVPRTSEACARVMKKYGINTVMKPTNTLRQALVKPKDKRPLTDSTGVVYSIPCHQCPKTYIGETGRKLGVRIEEHREEAEKNDTQAYTRSKRKVSETVENKSALTDHCQRDNHVIDWDSTKVMARESERFPRWIRESVHIRRQGRRNVLNRDKGQYDLPHLWDHALMHTGKLSVTAGQHSSSGSLRMPLDLRRGETVTTQ